MFFFFFLNFCFSLLFLSDVESRHVSRDFSCFFIRVLFFCRFHRVYYWFSTRFFANFGGGFLFRAFLGIFLVFFKGFLCSLGDMAFLSLFWIGILKFFFHFCSDFSSKFFGCFWGCCRWFCGINHCWSHRRKALVGRLSWHTFRCFVEGGQRHFVCLNILVCLEIFGVMLLFWVSVGGDIANFFCFQSSIFYTNVAEVGGHHLHRSRIFFWEEDKAKPSAVLWTFDGRVRLQRCSKWEWVKTSQAPNEPNKKVGAR